MTSTSTSNQQRKVGTALQRTQHLNQAKLRSSKPVLTASIWPGTDADPYILQRHAEKPVNATAHAMGWPND